MIDRIKELFEHQSSESYKRYDSSHPFNIYIGTNRRGLKCLAIIIDAPKESVDPSKTIAVDYYERDDGNMMLSFGLNDDSLSDLFYRFCDDIIESTRNSDPKYGFMPIINRWNTWIKFFSKSNLPLSENEIRGLIGEIYFLKEFMVPKYGISRSIEAFIGIDKAHKDFEIDDTWYEVKTIYNGAHTTKISSIEQLDSDKEGLLEIITLDQGTSGLDDLVTLNKVVDDFNSTLDDKNASIFNEKLRVAGYAYDARYDEYAYIFVSLDGYRVVENFPRIRKNTLPTGIIKASYEIDISAIQRYKVDT